MKVLSYLIHNLYAIYEYLNNSLLVVSRFNKMVNFQNDIDEQYENNNKRTKRYFTRTTLINGLLILSIFVGATSSGMAMGYPAVFLPQLQQNTTEITVDEDMGSWIDSF
ncbi:hypothetical protein FQA39_LY05894 [Lamprigera yunnana]|nr:hypothetical protein FQA39_LY05894 [Lamprigera yunnana]